MAFDPHANLLQVTVTVAPSPATSGTSVTVSTADATKLNNALSGAFNATVYPASIQPVDTNAEIIRVTNINTGSGVLTISRAQESSTARTIVVGDKIAVTITKKVITDMEDNINIAVNNLYKFHGYRNAAWTSANGVIGLDAEVFDTNSNFSTSTGRYTAPFNGYWYFSGQTTSGQASGIGYATEILVNGNVALKGVSFISSNTSGFAAATHASGLLFLTAGDYVELNHIGGGSATGVTGSPYTYLQGFLFSLT